jgi:hypothetical protein
MGTSTAFLHPAQGAHLGGTPLAALGFVRLAYKEKIWE